MGKNTRIILASASPRRIELMRQVGIKAEIVPSQIVEKAASKEPEEVVKELARQKAEDVAARIIEECGKNGKHKDKPDIVVIGADTVVSAEGNILGKPASKAEAESMIKMLQGKTHQVYTGVAIYFGDSGQWKVFVESTDVFVCPIDEDCIRQYVETGEPMDKAGAYGIQGLFAAFICRIEGDYNNVVGLPIGRVCRELMAAGKYPQ